MSKHMIFFKKQSDTHFYLYEKMAKFSRNRNFYKSCNFLDTIDGRFEILLVHVILLVRKLNSEDKDELAQLVVDLMFSTIDLSFREEGVGDLSIPKKMKKVGKVFYGRIASLDNILKMEDENQRKDETVNYFIRNAFLSDENYRTDAEKLSNYVNNFDKLLRNLEVEDILKIDEQDLVID